MAAYQIYTIFVVLLFIQCSFCKSLGNTGNSTDTSTDEMEPKQALLLYTAFTFISLGQSYAHKAANLSRLLLKDADLLANNDAEVLQFKSNLTQFVANYDANKEAELVWDIMDIYVNITDHYYDLPEAKQTLESKFILNLLNKYNCKKVETQLLKDFEPFVENFKRLFEDAKSVLEKPLLDWYEKFITLKDFEEKIDAIGEFIELA
ncbi:uncharacterized protein LOC135951628 [Calliphora vicina]|uniref:uncharacterized protein LOC135951628 n=1 Tax=Calliphora vicina TaxID=7373 RepID=UPI00325B7572